MNRTLLKRVVAGTVAWTAAAILSTAVALAQDPAPTSGARTDGQIEMDVVQALDASQALKNDLITAATIQSKVTLSGTVSSDDSKKLAESIVKGVPGVTGVDNNLKVGNPAADANAEGSPVDDSQDVADNGQQAAPPVMQGQDNDQNAPPDSGQNQQPPYPQNQQQPYPQNQQPYPQGQQAPYPQNQQAPPPGYGQAGPPPGYGQQAPPPPGYGQGGYGQAPYGGQQYGQTAPPRSYRYAKGPLTVPQGTMIQLRTTDAVASKRAKGGEPLQFTVIQDVTLNGYLAIPRGATVHGVVAEVKQAGQLAGSPELALQLTSLDMGGQTYPLQSDLFKVKGPGKGGRTASNVIGGALLGAIIGGAVGGGGGAAIGAAAGGGVGTAASAATPGPGVWIPAEALVTFHLTAPITVNPVGQQEAARLAEGLYPGGPSLYRRGYYGGPYGSPYPNYYGPVYYRPYFFSGGYYYWR